MADIALNDVGDLDIRAGLLQLVSDTAYRAQRIRIALRHRMGEWFRDQGAGTDYDGAILGKATEQSRRAELRRRLLEIPGVLEIASIQSELDRVARRWSADIVVMQDDGEPLEVSFSGRT